MKTIATQPLNLIKMYENPIQVSILHSRPVQAYNVKYCRYNSRTDKRRPLIMSRA